jgi:hypothetical protein
VKLSYLYTAMNLERIDASQKRCFVNRKQANFIAALSTQAVKDAAAAHNKKPLGLDRDSYSRGLCHSYCPP